MPRKLTPEQKRAVAARVGYYRDLGIRDFYRRDVAQPPSAVPDDGAPEVAGSAHHASAQGVPANDLAGNAASGHDFSRAASPPSSGASAPAASDPAAALRLIREDLGDCTRCTLHKLGRKQIVFGVGNPRAELMFVGEGPGADEDEQGEPFVGRAGQLLNKMIEAMGLKRSDVYIANVVKCRPPGNRTPERDECDTCSPFLLRQMDAIQPKAIVALGAVAAKTLLGMSATMAEMRGHTYEFRGSRLFVTYHPAYLLRDPRQKGEAWKDLQRVMKFLGLEVPQKTEH